MSGFVEVVVRGDHPCLAGHFPGEPLVPGSLILELVMGANPLLRARSGRLESVKFLTPLRPDQAMGIRYARVAPNRIAFTCRVAQTLICRGCFEVADGA
jgi:3-hydroxymyristoyl/3-hydroxydecanoyl-(acyl carrier protein) dehydratase